MVGGSETTWLTLPRMHLCSYHGTTSAKAGAWWGGEAEMGPKEVTQEKQS